MKLLALGVGASNSLAFRTAALRSSFFAHNILADRKESLIETGVFVRRVWHCCRGDGLLARRVVQGFVQEECESGPFVAINRIHATSQ